MLHLPQVTLIAVSSVELAGTDLALQISSHDIEFGAIKFLSSEEWQPSNAKIQMTKIPKLDIVGYSKFILGDLHEHVETEYCLVVQSDGFVLNANKWNPKFLEFDYIGAPWPMDLKLQPGNIALDLSRNNVGNGGFSLRSKRLLEATSKISFHDLTFPTKSEDLILCHFLFQEISNAGIKFPGPELAAQFSIESPTAAYGQNPSTCFGFHGKELRDLIFANAQL
ncbi:hypothetical protein CL55_00001280 [Polynucleobacter duraquae]|uniref:DUF5672 domain-containing protein n=1 Tax=Polynucleobacter duraquae TaxID=1835254 RepID=A0A0E3ZK81_9BURK|nr:DUF5672 family protein [Polynucleobacter duraquae]AKD24461.1 hypothetical protein CL55_00001280 [Polynucleobacter duraquae]